MSFSNGSQAKPTGSGSNNSWQSGYTPVGRLQNYTIYSKDSDRVLWEMRHNCTPNTTPASTVLNSPDLTDLDGKTRYQQSNIIQHHQIKVGRSPVGSGGNNDSNNSTNPSSPTQQYSGYSQGQFQQNCVQQPQHTYSSLSILSEGEMVVFDDIGASWQSKENPTHSPALSDNDSIASGLDKAEQSYYDVDSRITDSSKIQRIIGGLTIAEYEGSPRRFGNIHADDDVPPDVAAGSKTAANLPRPGFPKRVVSSSTVAAEGLDGKTQPHLIDFDTDGADDSYSKPTGSNAGTNPSHIDYIYEISDSEKFRNEFFTDIMRGNGNGSDDADDPQLNRCYIENQSMPQVDRDGQDDAMEPDDDSEHYASYPRNNSYVGRRLATKNTGDQDESQASKLSPYPSNSYPYHQNYHYTNQSHAVNPSGALYTQSYSVCHTEPASEQAQRLPNAVTGNAVNGGGDGNSNGGPSGHSIELYIEPSMRNCVVGGSNASVDNGYNEIAQQIDSKLRNFTLSPETTDYDSNCGDLDSEVSLRYMGNDYGLSGDFNGIAGTVDGSGVSNETKTDYGRLYSSMPILEDGLSSGHASDTENNLGLGGISIVMDHYSKDNGAGDSTKDDSVTLETGEDTPPLQPDGALLEEPTTDTIDEALKDIKATLQKTKVLLPNSGSGDGEERFEERTSSSPVWIPRSYNKARESPIASEQPTKAHSGDEEEADTDLETDRLLGQQRFDDHCFIDEKNWTDRSMGKVRSVRSPSLSLISKNQTALRAGVGTQISAESPVNNLNITNLYGNGGSGVVGTSSRDADPKTPGDKSPSNNIEFEKKGKCKTKEGLLDPAVLIEGVLFRARYLGSTQLVCEGQPTKSTRMMQAEEAVSRIKAPEGESQPSTEVDLFISTEKIMVLNTDLKEIMMDHALRTISYIADIGDLVVLMARRRFVPHDADVSDGAGTGIGTVGTSSAPVSSSQTDSPKKSIGRNNRTPKMICHVFESEEAQFIAQSIGQAFQVAYMEFLKANGIEDHSFMKEMDYQEVLNSQEIFGDELEIFAKKELQKEVVVPKAKGEILGVVIVESGWGSMLPTVVIANLASSGAAARCGQLNIGDQIIAINGLSMVGLPLSTCQSYIKNTKNQTAVKFTVVPCAPVVEVKIKRPNTKYQLGFSVQNGVICSLLRGGIAERGGVRVGHRIIEINNQSVVAVPHEKIVNLLATSVGEILMKTMPTSMFRLLTGQENPVYI